MRPSLSAINSLTIRVLLQKYNGVAKNLSFQTFFLPQMQKFFSIGLVEGDIEGQYPDTLGPPKNCSIFYRVNPTHMLMLK